MSRIIKEGALNEIPRTCQFCGCKFIYTLKDLYGIEGDKHMEIRQAYVNCPMCEIRLKLSFDEIHALLKKPEQNSDFMEDVKALAKQYGYKIDSIELSNNN